MNLDLITLYRPQEKLKAAKTVYYSVLMLHKYILVVLWEGPLAILLGEGFTGSWHCTLYDCIWGS